MTVAPDSSAGGVAAFRKIQRQLEGALDAAPSSAGERPSLESRRGAPLDPPRLARVELLEGSSVARRLVPGAPEVGFEAFLDGIQSSRVIIHDEATPVIHGSVAAVIRQRIDRRLTTWRQAMEGRIYAPRALLRPATNAALDGLGLDVIDTTPRRSTGDVDDDARHPLSLAESAVNAVQAHRETLELRLAEAWMERPELGVLYIDGGISGSAKVATSANAVGVVKSHRTLYGDPSAVRTVLTLAHGERSSVFAMESRSGWRSPVASWYLRLRTDGSGDPLWGLVRVEMAMPAESARGTVTARADQISRWVLAETSPLALPDGRWDTMAYGIRDCEQYLRALQ